MKLINYLDQKLIFLNVNGDDKDEILSNIVHKMSEEHAIPDEDDLLKELIKRESQGGTSLGNGIAIPHARLKSLDRIVVAVAKLSHSVNFDWGGNGDEKVRMVFVLVTPSDRAGEYLKVLAKLSKILKNHELKNQLLESNSIQDIWNLFELQENQDI